MHFGKSCKHCVTYGNKRVFLLKKKEENSTLGFLFFQGHLSGICGSVGAGKSSLLFGCLGQMRLVKGKLKVSGDIAYVGQQAWILNATLRDNILLGESYDPERLFA